MAEFPFTTENFLGYRCGGCAEYAYGDGTVELDDEQVEKLVSLIKANDGETDVEALGLEEKYPEIFKLLDEAYSCAAYDAEYWHWLLEGYQDGNLEEPEGMMEDLEKEGLFEYEPDLDAIREDLGLDEDEEISDDDLEEDKEAAFEEWLEEYMQNLDEAGLREFIEKYYGDQVDMSSGWDYTVGIPDGIIELALKKES